MKDRLARLIESENTSPARLAEIIGVQPSAISHILSGRNKPGFDFIANLLRGFPAINPKWLLLGEGEMYYQDNNRANVGSHPIIDEDLDKNITQSADVFAPLITNVTKENLDLLNNDSGAILSDEVLGANKAEEELPSHDAKVDNKPVIERVMVFYSDKSFEEYRND